MMNNNEHLTEDEKTNIHNKYSVGSITTMLICSCLFIVGYVLGSNQLSAASISSLLDNQSQPPKDIDMGEFWKVWNVLDKKFGGTSTSTSDQERIWGAIRGLTASYDDPYTTFLTPDEMKIFSENIKGTFSGVGMEISIQDGILTVISPLKGSPAEMAGFLPGDKIVRIDDTSTDSLSVDQAVLLIRGEAGTNVSITFFREGFTQPQTVSVTRKNIEIPTLETHQLTKQIYYARLHSFTEQSPELFSSVLQDYKRSGSHSLILDVRGNPGGYLEAAVEMASHFLPEGTIIVKEDYRDDAKDRNYRSKGYNTLPSNHTIIILIDEGSASASEILAGALKDEKRATVIGRTSFGKGSVQELVKISNDSALKVTIARWLTPGGQSLSENGIEPHITVTMTQEERLARIRSNKQSEIERIMSDPDIKRALQLIQTGK